jgi:hypothetical protein
MATTNRLQLSTSLLLAAAGAVTLVAGCPSPTEDALIESLGEEVSGVPEGELHRYGQPCLACHDAYLGEEPLMAVAGTVFATPIDEVTVEGAVVQLTDATGSQVTARTNCAGNFHVDLADWTPVFPLRAVVTCTLPDGRTRRNVMGTRIERDGSCASCHTNEAPGQDTPGRVFCTDEVLEQPFLQSTACSGGPGAGG